MTKDAEVGFRPDIEGLRAIAVLPVVALHAGFDSLAGGFLGVDIFFVISGYLITRLIVTDLDDKTFSFDRFYRRRASRIVPALVAMMLATLAGAWALWLRQDARDVGFSAIAASVFGANILFWFTTDYFSTLSAQPLLHLWSLGIEEQFYLLAPLALAGAYRGGLRIDRALTALAVVSLVGALVVVQSDPKTVFYLLPFRAWELALGGCVATVLLPAVRPRLANILAATGFVSICGALVLTTSSPMTIVPGTMAACAGTALLIASGPRTLTARLLSLKPLRWIGRLSYSLYLWHWPIIVFYKMETGATLGSRETGALVAVSVVAAWLSHRAIERPMRRRGVGLSAATAMLGLTAAAGSALALISIRPGPSEVDRIATYLDYSNTVQSRIQFRTGTCWLPDHIDVARCATPTNDRRNVLLVGNSFAAQLWRPLADRAPNARLLQATMAGCAAVLDGTGSPDCTAAANQTLRTLAIDPRVSHVILSHNWQSDPVARIGDTVRWLRAHGKRVTVIGAPVEFDAAFPRILANGLRRGDRRATEWFELPGGASIDHSLHAEVLKAGGAFYSLRARECPGGTCLSFAPDGAPLHFDGGHLTLSGARFLLRDLPPL